MSQSWYSGVEETQGCEAGTTTPISTILLDRYRLDRPIQSGIMGEVWLATDLLLERQVVLKRHPFRENKDRFQQEYKLTARLQHPAIIPLYEAGQIEKDCFYTMKLVEGEHFGAFIQRCYLDRPLRALRELLDYFVRACDAMAYAHQVGVLHRDLKPQNIMISETFREIYVIDLGLGVYIKEGLSPKEFAGTPAYMPPEQAQTHALTYTADVYALGAILYEILQGYPPWRGLSAPDIIAHLRQNDVPQPQQGPPELLDLVREALDPDPQKRLQTASELAQRVRDFLEGARREEQVQKLVKTVDALDTELVHLHQQEQSLQEQYQQQLATILPYSSDIEKHSVWSLEDQLQALYLERGRLHFQQEQQLENVLQLAPAHQDAHYRIAHLYQERHEDAIRRQDMLAATLAEARVKKHAQTESQHQWLRGEGLLSLHTQVVGLPVVGYREVDEGRRLLPKYWDFLGTTPLDRRVLPAGSWRLRVGAEAGFWLPVVIPRNGHWEGVLKDGRAIPVPMLDESCCYVPAGWYWEGDPTAPEGLLPKQRWVDGFVIQKFPVQVKDYFAFLNDLVKMGQRALAIRYAPYWNETHPCWAWSETGEILPTQDDIAAFLPDYPISGVDWDSAGAYAAWLQAKTGIAWRLPREREWEKAARGVDGRRYVWGNYFQPTWACVPDTASNPPVRVSVHQFPVDESPYGVRGLTGNVRDWCGDMYTRLGWGDGQDINLDLNYRMTRGGSWDASPAFCMAAARTAQLPNERRKWLGFRLVYSV